VNNMQKHNTYTTVLIIHLLGSFSFMNISVAQDISKHDLKFTFGLFEHRKESINFKFIKETEEVDCQLLEKYPNYRFGYVIESTSGLRFSSKPSIYFEVYEDGREGVTSNGDNEIWRSDHSKGRKNDTRHGYFFRLKDVKKYKSPFHRHEITIGGLFFKEINFKMFNCNEYLK